MADIKDRNDDLFSLYGLVPLAGESDQEFGSRANRLRYIIEVKKEFLKLTPDFGNETLTVKVQQVLKEYMGFKEVPLLAYRADLPDDYGGMTLIGRYGESSITIPSFKPVRNTLCNMLEDFLMTGQTAESITIRENIENRSRIRSNRPVMPKFRTTYAVPAPDIDELCLYKDVINLLNSDEEHIMLHEGIHAIINNNSGRCTSVLRVPLFRIQGLSKALESCFESEIMTYKTSLDLITDKLIDTAALRLRHHPSKIKTGAYGGEKGADLLKRYFHNKNTEITKGWATASIDKIYQYYNPKNFRYFGLAAAPLLGAANLLHDPHTAGYLIGATCTALFADALFITIKYSGIKSRIGDYTDAYGSLCDKHGAKDTLIMALGKDFKKLCEPKKRKKRWM